NVLSYRLFGLAAVVTLVEKQVDGLVDGVQALPYIRGAADFAESPRKLEQFSGTTQSLFDGVFGGQEGVGNFRNAETAKRLQDQRHLDFSRKLRMAAGEHHSELVVLDLHFKGGQFGRLILP